MLDDNGIRPPVIAAGINLFGGPLGLIHRHVTGAIPIRRNTKDPAYLVTLKAYVAELLQRHDLLFYIEGGRSYSGEMKAPKTGLLHAAMQADRSASMIVPMAVAYDLVLEDHILAHQGAKRRRGRSAREVAEMVRYAVGYQSRAFVTFGEPIPLDGYDPESRRDVMALAHLTRDTIGRLYKVLPTAVLAAGDAAVDHAARAREPRRGTSSTRSRAAGANLAVTSGREAVERAAEPLATRNIIHVERGGRFRVRERTVLRYYARTLQHLLAGRAARLARTDACPSRKAFFQALAGNKSAEDACVALRHARPQQLRAALHRRRNRRRSDRGRAPARSRRDDADARLPRRERRHDGRGRSRDPRLPRHAQRDRRGGHRPRTSR